VSRGPAPFTQAQINRAIKAAKAQGMTIRIERDGAMTVIPIPDQGDGLDSRNRPRSPSKGEILGRLDIVGAARGH
jgi:glucose-6-phosphate-specific signal transduction histidine kinase